MSSEATRAMNTIELSEPASLPPSLSGALGEPERPLFEGSLRERLDKPFEALAIEQQAGLRRPVALPVASNRGIKWGGLTVLIVLGAALGGIIAVHPYFNTKKAAPVAAVASVLPAVEYDELLAYRAAEPKTVEMPAAPVATEQSNIVAHTQGLPIALAERQFLLAQGGARSIPNGYVAAPADPAFHRMTDPELLELGSGQGRYTSSQGSLEWQGGWRFGDTASNIERGQQYREYIGSQVGSPFSNRLSATIQQPTKLLPQVSRTR